MFEVQRKGVLMSRPGMTMAAVIEQQRETEQRMTCIAKTLPGRFTARNLWQAMIRRASFRDASFESIRHRIRYMAKSGLLEVVERGKGSRPTTYRVKGK